MVVSPTICNVKLRRVLVDGGAALNILSPTAYDLIKVPGMKLLSSLPIIGVMPGHTWPRVYTCELFCPQREGHIPWR
uniref:Uncharacterized protein n=1 Tax=Oryza punctata TaxID=4537 RepID=A0A0E0KTC6_ORYPU